MEKQKIVYGIYDGRYHSDPDRAICCEVCETLKEARKNKSEYGDDTVIVKSWLAPIGRNKYIEIKSEIIK